jgi:NitT/TauT family transport system substrate-binding protein
MRARFLCLAALLFLSLPCQSFSANAPLRLGLLSFGTVRWEIDTMRRLHLDQDAGVDIRVRDLASNEAAKLALLGGAVDVIVSDWVFVARQRAAGEDLVFLPGTGATGTLLARHGAQERSLGDLRGKRIGVAGGPLDKSWLILRALALKETGVDLAAAATPVFAAPPLLRAEFEAGRLDALLTYWNDAALLEAAGALPIVSVAEMMRRLGIGEPVPMLGFVARESWAARNEPALNALVAAQRRAHAVLAGDRTAWRDIRLPPADGGVDVVAVVQEAYRRGGAGRWTPQTSAAAARLFGILAELGGEDLVGGAQSLDGGTFWKNGTQ